MLFGFKTKKSFNIFQSMMQKKTNGKMRTKEAPLVIILILTLQTKNDLFYEFLQSPIPIKEFEFKEKNALDLLNPKDKYTLIKEYMYEVKKWKKSFGRSMNKVNRTSLVFVDLCEVLKVQKKKY